MVITINKANVFNEIAKTTSYAAAKAASDGSMFEQISLFDSDREAAERFWNEACNTATTALSRMLVRVSSSSPSHGVNLIRDYEVELAPIARYDTKLTDGAASSLFSFFVNFIVSKWMGMAAKDMAEQYAAEAAVNLKDVTDRLMKRTKPTRV